jgi:hypothetical protein
VLVVAFCRSHVPNRCTYRHYCKLSTVLFLKACFIRCADLTTCPLYFLFLCGISFHMFGCSIIRPIGACPSESFLYWLPCFGLPAHLFTWEVSVSQDYISCYAIITTVRDLNTLSLSLSLDVSLRLLSSRRTIWSKVTQ